MSMLLLYIVVAKRDFHWVGARGYDGGVNPRVPEPFDVYAATMY